MKRTLAQLLPELAQCLRETEGDPEGDIATVLRGMYTVDDRLQKYIDELAVHVEAPSKESRATAGKTLERISYLAFKGLAGFPAISAFRSATVFCADRTSIAAGA